MAELVNQDAMVRFLAGYEENLSGKAIENGTVYFALKPDPSNSSNTVGSIYIDANGKRIIMSGDGVAITDTQGHLILTKYIKAIEMDGSAGSKAVLTYYKGNGDDVPVDMPTAGADTAGVVTTGAQTFAGAKTFSNKLTINGASNFEYAGIEGATSNSARVVWFAHASKKGTPVYHNDFTYNPGTKTLKVANVDGLAAKATGDGQGNDIYATYLKDLEGTTGADTYVIKGIKGNSDHSPTTLTIPEASTEVAGLMSTTSQTLKGKKTFQAFRYSGIVENKTLTTNQPIWFMDHASTLGTPAYNKDLTYNPSTNTLKATNFDGVASKATADGNGLNIRENYLKNIENTNSDKHILTLIKGNDNTVDLTLGFVLKSGDTMTGELKTSFKDAVVGGSYASSKHTIPDLVEEVRYSSGVIGSFQLTTAYESPTTKETIPVGWYNFEYIPHRKGGTNGQASGDNCNYGTLLLYGMTVDQQHWRIRFASEQIAEVRRVYNYGDIVTRATGDSAGNNILDKYISEIAISEHTGNSFKFKAYDGNGDDQNEIVLPIDTTGTLASLIVNGAQTLLGIKTFTDGLKVTSKEFRYTGIEVATANQARAVWFADSGEVGKPVYNTNFMYNPSTQTLTVKNITGTISNAIKDEQGNTIYTFYLKDIDSETGTETFKFWGVKGNNDDGTIITIPKATTTVAGLMATTAQTFKGNKSFKNHIILDGDNANNSQIRKAGSSTSWIYGRDTAAVRITTHDTDAMYNAVTSMKTTNGDWSNGVYSADNMYWTYTPDTQYTAKDNKGYTQMILSKEGLLTVPSILAQTRINIGGTNTSYALYNSGSTYLGDTLTVEGATQLNNTLRVSKAATFSDNVTVAKQITAEKIVIKDTTSKPAAGVDVPLLTVQYQNTAGTYYDATDIISAVGTGATSETNNASFRIGSHSGSLFLTAGECAKNMISTLAGSVANTESIFLFSDGNITGYVGCANDAKTYTKAFTVNTSKFNVDINLGVTGDTTLSKTLTVTGTTTLKSTAYAEMDIESKGDILATAGDLTQNIGGGISGNGWNFWGRLRSWHPEKVVRPTSANIAPKGDASLSYFLASSSMTTGKPDMDSHIIHLEWDSTAGWSGQIAVPTGKTGHMQWRTQGGSSGTSWGGNWRTILDMYNFDEADKLETVFVHTAGDEMSGDLKLPNLEATGKITTPILIASNYVTIGGAANSNYGLYNYKTTFFADVLEVDADTKLKRLVITETSAAKHIEFKRGGWNYFATPASGCFAFLPNGASTGEDNSRLVIENGGIRPGKTNTYDLGTSSKYWKAGYIQTLAVSANATVGGTLTVTGKTTLKGALEVAGATTLKTTLAVTGATTLNSTLTVKNEISAEGNIWVKGANPYVGFMEGTTTVGYLQADGDVLGLGSTWSSSMKIDRTGNVTIPAGVLTLKGNMYEDAYNGALNMSNSDIYGLNSIYTCDLAESSAEGIHFYRTATTVDSIWVANGTIYFTPNRTLGTAGTSYHILHSNNYWNHLDGRYILRSGDSMDGHLYANNGLTWTNAYWTAPGNIVCTANGGNVEFSFDMGAGTQWHVWSSPNSTSMLSCFADSKYVQVHHHLQVGNYNNGSYALTTDSFICQSWIRTTGNTGWYNETHGGGIYMEDSSWVRTYNGKNFYCSAVIQAGNRIYTGYDSGVANSISCSGWFRSSGNSGWYNASYGGGWYQTDTTYIRTHGTFQVYSPGRYLSGDVPSSWIDGLKNQAAYRIEACNDTGSYHPWMQQTNNRSGYAFSMGILNTTFYIIGCPSSRTDNSYTASLTFNMSNGYLQGCSRVYNAIWNDYAEFRKANTVEPGRVVIEGKFGTMLKSTARLQAGGSIVSDTYGTAMGETDECKTPIAVAGRALAYTYEPIEEFEIGDVVCTGPNGTVSKMTREEIREWPDRIVGIVSEIPTYETWGQENTKVNGRIWIKVK